MEMSQVLDIALPIVFIVVGIVLVWLIVELALTFRKTRQTVSEVQTQLVPTLENVNEIVANVKPVAGKVDPLVDRVSLTVDAANLEIMRVDQILEDVGQITDSVTKTVDAVDSVTNAPLELVSSVTEKMRSKLKTKTASDESVRLGQTPQDAIKAAPNAVREFVDAASDIASSAVQEQREKRAERKVVRDARNAESEMQEEMISSAVADVTEVAVANASSAEPAKQQSDYVSIPEEKVD